MSLLIQYYYLFGVMHYVRVSVWVLSGTMVTHNVLISTPMVHSRAGLFLTSYSRGIIWSLRNSLSLAVLLGCCSIELLLFFRYQQCGVCTYHAKKKSSVSYLSSWQALCRCSRYIDYFQPWHNPANTFFRGAVASVISLYYRVLLQNDPTDTTWKVGYTLLWT